MKQIVKTKRKNDSNDSLNEAEQYPLGCVTKLSDYILKSREERIAHIDLTTECEFEGPTRDKHILLNYLRIEDNVDNWQKSCIHRCHLCENGRRRGGCKNPRHIYFGTASENQFDTDAEWRKQRSHKAGSNSKGRVNSKNLEKYELFKLEYSTDVSLHSWSLRKLGRRYGVCNQAIKKWIVYFESEQ